MEKQNFKTFIVTLTDLENNVLKLHYIFPLNEIENLIIYTRTSTVNPPQKTLIKKASGECSSTSEGSLIKQSNTGKYSELYIALGN